MRATSSADSPARIRAWMSRGDRDEVACGATKVADAVVVPPSTRSALCTRSSIGSARRRPTSSARTNAWPSSERATNRTGRIACLRPPRTSTPVGDASRHSTRNPNDVPGRRAGGTENLDALDDVVDAGGQRLDVGGLDVREHPDAQLVAAEFAV